ncbi:hypothetical protein CQ017_16470 [Arthrobacter sp. MYb224]|uniref:DUF6308 family protein n=2 Tax=Micrococcales TaxID=85006 RepID=UPI000CFC71E5|nr:DUF6308 family protein [Arthrobacter sp. MYb224]PQZ96772.1 hypothetical protein CQ017_16470 [Arthrobacter sp. MYb224]
MSEMVKVGGAEKPRDEVLEYAADYLRGIGRYAYPAYDAYPGTDSDQVGDADLLAICLLNAGQKPIPIYYGLQSRIPDMNEVLARLPKDEPFAEASLETLETITDFFGILGAKPTTQVGKTKLLKVLHRKRPELIPLFDENIRRCYSLIGAAPVPPIGSRTHRDFAIAWLPELQRDVVQQMSVWQEIVAMADPAVSITPLRALDIVGWDLGTPRRQ